MKCLVLTHFVRDGRVCFTGNMMQQDTPKNAFKFAEEEAERIGAELGVPVIRESETIFNIDIARVEVQITD